MENLIKRKPRIFLIGFNKCGTTSFHYYFNKNNISSVHWRANTLAQTIAANSSRNYKLLNGLENWIAYTDMICIPGSPWGRSNSDHSQLIEGCRYFRELHRDYPDSLFILNTRDPLQWIRSRLAHDQGQFAKAYLTAIKSEGIHNIKKLKQRWLRDWYQHHYDVLEYFSANSPKQFLLFHISETPVRKLNHFLDPHFKITYRKFPHHHKSE